MSLSVPHLSVPIVSLSGAVQAIFDVRSPDRPLADPLVMMNTSETVSLGVTRNISWVIRCSLNGRQLQIETLFLTVFVDRLVLEMAIL